MKSAFFFVCLIFYGLQSSAQDLEIPDREVKVPDKEISIKIPLLGIVKIKQNSKSILEEYANLILIQENESGIVSSFDEKRTPKENNTHVAFTKN